MSEPTGEWKKRKDTALQVIGQQIAELQGIGDDAKRDHNYATAVQRLRRWESRTGRILAAKVSPAEANLLAAERLSMAFGTEYGEFTIQSDAYLAFLEALLEEVVEHPENVLVAKPAADPQPIVTRPAPTGRAVFIIHGYDDLNLWRLRDLLKDEWHLDAIVLQEKPGKTRPLIQKFEEEAELAIFAFALLTPGDIVQAGPSEYCQARPNVVFELGWFCGRLGRDRVCIILKEGTKIHSDLDGISRVQFVEDVRDKVLLIKRELVAAGLVKPSYART